MRKIQIAFVLVSLCLFYCACSPAVYEHAVVNETDAEITIEFADARINENTITFSGTAPAKSSIEDFKKNKDAWRVLDKSEFEFVTAKQTAANTENQLAKGFRVRLAPREVLRIYKSDRLSGSLDLDSSLEITGKLGKIRYEGKQVIEQLQPYSRSFFGLDSTVYVVWYR